MNEQRSIGYIVGGSLRESFLARLTVDPVTVQEGSFVVTDSENLRFYGLVTDIRLGSTDPRFADEQTEGKFPAVIAKALHGQTLLATRLKKATSLSARPASRVTPSASTSINSCSDPRACLALLALANPSLPALFWPA